MSHNVRLKGVKFANIEILKAAVEEMRNEGAKVQLIVSETRNLVARASGVGARDVPCQVLLQVQDGKWDVGFNYDENGVLIPELESMFRHDALTADTRHAAPVEGCRVDYGGIQIGLLTQRYALVQAEINAAQAGFATTRVFDKDKRQFELQVTVG